ncbi:MAG: HAMP domain-containing histidine kinase [Myxococcales bacterium]|nr:HAMP domain-containing histidine kinase [Myxococcales bacterium]
MPRLSIVARVSIAVLAVALAFGLALLDVVLGGRALAARLTRLNDEVVPVLRELDDMRRDLVALTELSREQDPVIVRQALRVAIRLPGSELERSVFDDLHLTASRLAEDPLLAEHQGWWLNLAVTFTELGGLQAQVQGLMRQLLQTLEADNPHASEIRVHLLETLGHFDKRLADVADLVRVQIDIEGDAIRLAEKQTFRRTAVVSGFALLLATTMIVLVWRSLRPVQLLTQAAGRIRRGDYSAVPVPTTRDEVGNLAAEFVEMAHAIRERDQQLRSKNDDLQQALHALLDAQRARVEAERMAAVGELTSRITHELRNPLSSIGLNVEMLADEVESLTGDGSEARLMVGSIDREVQRLMRLTDDFLSIARGVARQEVVDIVPVIQDVGKLMQASFQQSGIRFEIRADVAQVFGDENQLRQVLINLFRNAVTALGENHHNDENARIVVTVEESDHDVCIYVDDNGPGVSDEVRARVFEPFFTTRASGTGLGLSICRDIVDGHRGHLMLESPGPLGGVRVTLRLPAIDAE